MQEGTAGPVLAKGRREIAMFRGRIGIRVMEKFASLKCTVNYA